MDPISALSVAGTVVQFVDFGTRLLSTGTDLYNSSTGVSTTNAQLETVATATQSIITKLRQTVRSPDTLDPSDTGENGINLSFDQICDGVASIAEQLLAKLQTLKVENIKHKKWHSFRKALRSIWSEQEIAHLVERLGVFKAALTTHVLSNLCDKIDDQAIRLSALFQRLDDQPKLIVSSLLDPTNRSSFMGPVIQLLRRLDHEDRKNERDIYRTGFQDSHSSAKPDRDLVEAFELLGISPEKERLLRNETTKAIIRSLSYDQMIARYEGIIDPYPDTFEWVFHDAVAEQLPWDCFISWLKTGTGIYWIGGKPGSGKSTLVKHIFEDGRFRQYLKDWAQRSPLCMASCFFWNSGTLDQRSQTGFFKTLLFQIFTQYPDLVPLAVPELWALTYPTLTSHGVSLLPSSTWNLRQLVAAFEGAFKQTGIPVKIALLVDGLDEFDGDHEEFVQFLKTISASRNVKLCVSSRPWIVFKDAFSGCAKLSLQNLTYDDIMHYTQDRFNKSPAFCNLLSIEKEAKSMLLQEVVEKAQGVFLWVRLVVTSLLRGIRNRDGIDDLLKRLHAIPDDLDRLYTHLLDIIEPIYLGWASKTFQTIKKARELEDNPLGRADPKSSGKLRTSQLTLPSFALAMDENFDMDQSQRFSTQSLELLCQKTEIHTTARCGGFLEVFCPIHKTEGDCHRAPIGYIHRTARDYLETPSHWSRILTWTELEDFDPCLTLLKGCVRLQSLSYVLPKCKEGSICNLTPEGSTGKLDDKFVISALVYAHRMDSSLIALRLSQIECLDRLDTICMETTTECRPHWSKKLQNVDGRIHLDYESFLDLATLFQLADYVDAKLALEKEPSLYASDLLLHRLLPNRHWNLSPECPTPCAKMVSVLLAHGADPNRKYRGLSPWDNAFRFLYSFRNSKDRNITRECFKIVQLLLSAGGDPYARIILQQECNLYMIRASTAYTPLQLLNNLQPMDPVAAQDVINEYYRLTMPKISVADCMKCKSCELASETASCAVGSLNRSRKRTREVNDLDGREGSGRSCR